MNRILFLITLFTLTSIAACKKSDNNNASIDCSGTAPKYSTDASPVFVSKCATGSGCHGAGATNSGGVLTNHTQIFNKRSDIRSSVVSGSMPRGSTLTDTEKKAIICWIDAGAANN